MAGEKKPEKKPAVKPPAQPPKPAAAVVGAASAAVSQLKELSLEEAMKYIQDAKADIRDPKVREQFLKDAQEKLAAQGKTLPKAMTDTLSKMEGVVKDPIGALGAVLPIDAKSLEKFRNSFIQGISGAASAVGDWFNKIKENAPSMPDIKLPGKEDIKPPAPIDPGQVGTLPSATVVASTGHRPDLAGETRGEFGRAVHTAKPTEPAAAVTVAEVVPQKPETAPALGLA